MRKFCRIGVDRNYGNTSVCANLILQRLKPRAFLDESGTIKAVALRKSIRAGALRHASSNAKAFLRSLGTFAANPARAKACACKTVSN